MLEDILNMMGRMAMSKSDKSKWPQVAKLSPEDLLKEKNLFSEVGKKQRQMNLLRNKIDKIKSELREMDDEWWNYLYDKYSLFPADYHIKNDGSILRRPENEEDEDNK